MNIPLEVGNNLVLPQSDFAQKGLELSMLLGQQEQKKRADASKNIESIDVKDIWQTRDGAVAGAFVQQATDYLMSEPYIKAKKGSAEHIKGERIKQNLKGFLGLSKDFNKRFSENEKFAQGRRPEEIDPNSFQAFTEFSQPVEFSKAEIDAQGNLLLDGKNIFSHPSYSSEMPSIRLGEEKVDLFSLIPKEKTGVAVGGRGQFGRPSVDKELERITTNYELNTKREMLFKEMAYKHADLQGLNDDVFDMYYKKALQDDGLRAKIEADMLSVLANESLSRYGTKAPSEREGDEGSGGVEPKTISDVLRPTRFDVVNYEKTTTAEGNEVRTEKDRRSLNGFTVGDIPISIRRNGRVQKSVVTSLGVDNDGNLYVEGYTGDEPKDEGFSIRMGNDKTYTFNEKLNNVEENEFLQKLYDKYRTQFTKIGVTSKNIKEYLLSENMSF